MGWLIGIIIGLIIIMVIIKIGTRNREEEGLWSQVRSIGRGACAKFKDKLFGC